MTKIGKKWKKKPKKFKKIQKNSKKFEKIRKNLNLFFALFLAMFSINVQHLIYNTTEKRNNGTLGSVFSVGCR